MNILLEKTRFSAAVKNNKRAKRQDNLPLNKPLFAFAVIMVVFGLVFTYSSSAFDSMHYFKRQLMFDIIGFSFMLFLAKFFTKLHTLKFFNPLYILWFCWILLVWALFSPEAAHTHRWINLGFFNLQRSVFAKVALIIYLASFFSKRPLRTRTAMTYAIPIGYSIITILLIYAGRDLGIPILLGAVLFAMLIGVEMPFKWSGILISLSLPCIALAIFHKAYRLKRMFGFLFGEESYQLQHSFYAIGSGGWFGKGFGASDMKLEYMPAAHTDFIFAIICEEGGLLVALGIITAFTWLLIVGITRARRAKNIYHTYLISGLTLCMFFQAMINMCVATGMAPTKGLPLPFFSYGGSSVIVTLAMIGILMNLFAVEDNN
ncbi:MAG: cell division protein FtsW [Elusimicrobiaceae bacterium]|nr:cell division protein FtsW [Elusimicrobiaceae bacterium]